jgi:phenylpyruvate tautomerase PptA (4-oxalocrotonate tautomerase family)
VALVRIELLAGHSAERKRQLLDGVHDALVAALEVPPGDPTLRIVEHDRADLRLPSFPRVVGDHFALIEITMFAGRSLDAKRALYREIVDRLSRLGIPADDITIVVIESPTENWGVRGGTPASEVDLGFTVEI